jgi:hypothetical protein
MYSIKVRGALVTDWSCIWDMFREIILNVSVLDLRVHEGNSIPRRATFMT